MASTKQNMTVRGFIRRHCDPSLTVPDTIQELCFLFYVTVLCDTWNAALCTSDGWMITDESSITKTHLKRSIFRPDYAGGSIIVEKYDFQEWRFKIMCSHLPLPYVSFGIVPAQKDDVCLKYTVNSKATYWYQCNGGIKTVNGITLDINGPNCKSGDVFVMTLSN